MPQRTWVRLSLVEASGMIMWLYTWAMAEPWPEKRFRLSTSAPRMAPYSSGSCLSIQESKVGPMLKLILV